MKKLVLTASLSLLAATSVTAQWQTNGVAVCTAAMDQYDQEIVRDGAGGAIIAWQDFRNVSPDIFAQRVNGTGMAQWTADGVPVCTATSGQLCNAVVSDGAGGAIITWYNSNPLDIYAQRLNSAGAAQWTVNGVAVCAATGYQGNPAIASDNTGGAIIAWSDERSNETDIYAQRINSSGAVQWAANGVAICAVTGPKGDPAIISDGTGGAIITWYDLRSGGDIYIQRVNASGVVQWTTEGVAICVGTVDWQIPAIVSDGACGALIAWHDLRSGGDIYVQRVNASGVVQWTANGIPICMSTGNQEYPNIVSDGAGGAIITWHDNRGGNSDIYTQKVDSSGAVQWTTNGVAVCTATGNQQNPIITYDGAGGAIITWNDNRNGNSDIYTQKVDSSGATQWTTEAVAICTAAGNQSSPKIASDGAGGSIIVWQDNCGGNYDIYVQRIKNNGCCSNPIIKTVADVPDDQGGKVWIEWLSVNNDCLPDTVISYYSVWRSLSGPGIKQTFIPGEEMISPGEMHYNFIGPGCWLAERNGKIYAWEWLANIPAHYFDRYSYLASTGCDSMAGNTNWHHFLVSAQTDNQALFWDSAPDSGYSVDNVAPTKALLLEGQLLKGPKADIRLDWTRETVADLWRYGVYRDVSSGFTPGPGNLVCYSDDTTETDGPAAACWYKVTAFDIHGNEGAPSNGWYYDGSTAVQLSMFAAMELEDGRVSVRWRTESEESCLRWEVERSSDPNSNYQLLGSVAGQGSTSQPTDYRYDDESELGPGTYYYRLGQVDLDGGKRYYGPVGLNYRWQVPAEAGVSGARPNPFNQTTTISYQTTTSGPVSLKVYNVYGQLVRTLGSGTKPAGYHRARWDGRSDRGEAVSAGVYLVRLEGVGISASARVAVVR